MAEPLHTEDVRSRKIYEEQANGRPFKKALSGRVPTSLGPRGIEPNAPTYEQTGRDHFRNITEIASSKTVVWGGPLPGDVYGATTIKGSSMQPRGRQIHIDYDQYSDYGLRGFGLMDDYELPTIIKASKYLRSHGLPTEKPIRVMELREVYVGNGINKHRVPIEQWENEQLDLFKEHSIGDVTYDKVKRYLKETKFITLERDVQVDERILDLIHLPLEVNLAREMARIFKWLNAAVKARGSGLVSGTPEPEPFKPTGDDIKRYFEEYLPSQMGTYLGRFHRLGLFHRFLHPGNWSIVGTIYDLDSITGRALFTDDPIPTLNDYYNDVNSTIECLTALNKAISDRGETDLPEIHVTTQWYQFALSYLQEKYKGKDKLTEQEIKQNSVDLYLYNFIKLYIPPVIILNPM